MQHYISQNIFIKQKNPWLYHLELVIHDCLMFIDHRHFCTFCCIFKEFSFIIAELRNLIFKLDEPEKCVENGPDFSTLSYGMIRDEDPDPDSFGSVDLDSESGSGSRGIK